MRRRRESFSTCDACYHWGQELIPAVSVTLFISPFKNSVLDVTFFKQNCTKVVTRLYQAKENDRERKEIHNDANSSRC